MLRGKRAMSYFRENQWNKQLKLALDNLVTSLYKRRKVYNQK